MLYLNKLLTVALICGSTCLISSCNSINDIQNLFSSETDNAQDSEDQQMQKAAEEKEKKRKFFNEHLDGDQQYYFEGEHVQSERVDIIVPKGWNAVLSLGGTAVDLSREDLAAHVSAETWKPLPKVHVNRNNFCDNWVKASKNSKDNINTKKPLLYKNEVSSICIVEYYSKPSSTYYFKFAEFMDTGNISVITVNSTAGIPADVLIRAAFSESYNNEMNINIRHALGQFTPYEEYKLVKEYDVPLYEGVLE